MTKPQQEMEPRTFRFGNTTVIIHSQLAWMTRSEQRAWFQKELKQGNPILRQIAQTVFD